MECRFYYPLAFPQVSMLGKVLNSLEIGGLRLKIRWHELTFTNICCTVRRFCLWGITFRLSASPHSYKTYCFALEPAKIRSILLFLEIQCLKLYFNEFSKASMDLQVEFLKALNCQRNLQNLHQIYS